MIMIETFEYFKVETIVEEDVLVSSWTTTWEGSSSRTSLESTNPLLSRLFWFQTFRFTSKIKHSFSNQDHLQLEQTIGTKLCSKLYWTEPVEFWRKNSQASDYLIQSIVIEIYKSYEAFN